MTSGEILPLTQRDSTTISDEKSGYFELVVRPMLQQGHEGELLSWLKEMSLIRSTATCLRGDCKSRNLNWNPARTVDKYNWSCPQCTRKQSIREDSFFLKINCDLKTCLQIVLAWCKAIPSEDTALILDVKEHIVKKVYERCAKVAEAYVLRHPEDWNLGGQNMVMIIDEFPGGYMSDGSTDIVVSRKRNNNMHTVLSIAEADAVPPRMWLHIMQSHPEPMKVDKSQVVPKYGSSEEALKEILRHVRPGSFIVANSNARSYSFETLCELQQYKVISIESLQKYDPPGGSKLMENLKTIWQTGLVVCEDVQEKTYMVGRQILLTHLWRQRFSSWPSTPFQYMLNHIAEHYRFA